MFRLAVILLFMSISCSLVAGLFSNMDAKLEDYLDEAIPITDQAIIDQIRSQMDPALRAEIDAPGWWKHNKILYYLGAGLCLFVEETTWEPRNGYPVKSRFPCAYDGYQLPPPKSS